MKRFKIVTLAAVAVLGLGALGGAAVRANASDTNSTSPAAAPPASAVAVPTAVSVDPHPVSTTSIAAVAAATTARTIRVIADSPASRPAPYPALVSWDHSMCVLYDARGNGSFAYGGVAH